MTWGRMEAVLNIITSTGGESAIDDFLSGKLKIVRTEDQRPTFKVTVNYGQTLKEMIEKGKFNWVNDNINSKNFPIEGKGQVETEVVLFHFNKTITSEEVIKEMEKEGYCPANIAELLALAEKEPDLQRQFPIASLGSVWRGPSGFHDVSCLSRSISARYLNLYWFEDSWNDDWRFAALRKS